MRHAALRELDGLVELVEQFGGPLSPVVFDPSCEIFRLAGVDGAIGYRRSPMGCVVGLGDPICAPEDMVRLAEGFRERFEVTLFAGASRRFADVADQLGWAGIEFGEELTLDPRGGLPHGRRGHELRRKLNHARGRGVQVLAYGPHAPIDLLLEREMVGIADAWLRARRGMQVFVSHINLFNPRQCRRWFYAVNGQELVGVLSLVRLGARDGWLIEHLLPAPASPVGTPESLVAAALEALRADSCPFITFGPSPAHALGIMRRLSSHSQWLGRWFFSQAQRTFHLDSLARFRQKFGTIVVEPSFLLFNPPRVGPWQLLALMRAFNVSLA
jgi:lysylphosphatidylglycerol synthetase-like protein (DUF2156 family)